MNGFTQKIFPTIKGSYRMLALAVGLLIVVVIVLNAGYYVLSQSPKTCLVCHYIRPYYNLWSKSNHREVKCVSCHKDRRWLTAPYALRYITASYTHQPIAQIDDETCLDCHEGQALDTAQTYEGKISFNHKLHLTTPVRGVQLHCITCHNHRQPGSYLQVDHEVCFLCHFKGAEPGHAQTGCQSCHGNPKQAVEHQGFQFNHQAYLDIGVQCGQCHVSVAKGDAAVSQEACFSCHVSRVEKFSDFPLIHEVHVHQNMVDCFRCHGTLEHGEFEMISSLQVRCEACHVKLHTPEKQMYIGSGGQGLPDEPSRMFLAQVSCDGCHKSAEEIGEVKFGARALITERQSCLMCHGKGYDLMMDKWVQGAAAMVREMEPFLKQTENLLKSSGESRSEQDTAQSIVAQARYNFDFVADGKGAHNVFYAIHLLQHSVENLKQVRKQLGLPEAPQSPGPILGRSDGYCNLLCHEQMPTSSTLTYQAMKFPHLMHSQELELGCGTCHPTDQHRRKIILHDACRKCHHQEYPIACTLCHWQQNELYHGQSPELGLKDAPDAMAKAEVTCDGCHDLSKEHSITAVAEKCAECHDTDYKGLLLQWAGEISEAQTKLAAELDSAKVELDQARQVGQKVHDETQALDEISKRADFIQHAGALHNYSATEGIYQVLRDKLQEIRGRLVTEKKEIK